MQYLKSNKLKIAIVIANPIGWNKSENYGGGEVVTCEIINRINQIDYTVITPSANLPLVESSKVKLIEINKLNNIFSFLEFSIKCFFYLLKNNSKFDIFYASTTNISEILPVFVAGKICRKKIITKYHLSVYKKSGKNIAISIFNNLKQEGILGVSLIIKWISISLTFFIIKNFDAIFCVSKSALVELEAYIKKNKLYLVENGIDIEKLSKYKTNKKIYDICFLGRLEKYKGIYEFIDIAKKLNLKAVIIGSGSESNILNACLRKQDQMKNIHLLGHLKNERFEYLASSKYLLVLSNSNEGFGLTIAEALAVGTQVICLKNDVLQRVYRNIREVTFLDTRDEIIEMLKQKRITVHGSRFTDNNSYLTENGQRRTVHDFSRFDIRKSSQIEVQYINEVFRKN
ncbi:glycosyltransferase [Patescibacteria group bacterium]|nr:glycosyltransferase [Patescibacteria group bacterium]